MSKYGPTTVGGFMPRMRRAVDDLVQAGRLDDVRAFERRLASGEWTSPFHGASEHDALRAYVRDALQRASA